MKIKTLKHLTVFLLLINCKQKENNTPKTLHSNTENIINVEKKPKLSTVADTLRVYTGLGSQLLSMSHNIEGFFVPKTKNTFPNSETNINNMNYTDLEGLLTLSALVYKDGKPIGIANETEIIYDFSKKSDANTMWLLRMNAKGYTGFITVEQIENPANADAKIQQELMEAQSKGLKIDKDFLLRTTNKEGAIITHASGDFKKYLGGSFTEYSIVNTGTPNRNGILLEFISKPN